MPPVHQERRVPGRGWSSLCIEVPLNLIIALSAPKSPRGLKRRAHAIFESRRNIAADAGCAEASTSKTTGYVI